MAIYHFSAATAAASKQEEESANADRHAHPKQAIGKRKRAASPECAQQLRAHRPCAHLLRTGALGRAEHTSANTNCTRERKRKRKADTETQPIIIIIVVAVIIIIIVIATNGRWFRWKKHAPGPTSLTHSAAGAVCCRIALRLLHNSALIARRGRRSNNRLTRSDPIGSEL